MAAKKARPRNGEAGSRPGRAGGPGKPFRRKSCLFCKDKVREVDYKNVNQLRRYISDRGKIRGASDDRSVPEAPAASRARDQASPGDGAAAVRGRSRPPFAVPLERALLTTPPPGREAGASRAGLVGDA